MGMIYGAIQTADQPVTALSDTYLLRDIFNTSQALMIATNAIANDKSPNREQIAFYSPVESKGNLEELIGEARRRAASGSLEIQDFLTVVDSSIQKMVEQKAIQFSQSFKLPNAPGYREAATLFYANIKNNITEHSSGHEPTNFAQVMPTLTNTVVWKYHPHHIQGRTAELAPAVPQNSYAIVSPGAQL